MSYAPSTPLVSTSSKDEVQVGQAPLTPAPDSSVNFADDQEARSWLDTNVLPLLDTVRSDSSENHAEWGVIRRMANLVRDETAAYEGQSNAYLPVYLKLRETRVSHLSRGLFPSDTYIDVDSENVEIDEHSQIVRAWMMHQLERSAKLRSELKPFLRSLTDYGLAVAKVWWEKPVNPVKSSRMTRLPGIEQMLYNYSDEAHWKTEGARFKARSVFSWYMWPSTVNSIDEASLVFEDIQVSKQYVDSMGKAGIWKNVDEINAASNADIQNPELAIGLAEVHGSGNTAVDIRQGDLATWTLLTECWLRMPVPRKLYMDNEVPGCPVPVKAVFSGGTLIEVRRNPFWHQKPPYVMQRMGEVTDMLYSTGLGRSAQSGQALINDFINQTNDNGIYGLNPIIKFNPNMVVGPLEPLAPGRMFPILDPQGMVFDRPPIEQMQYGLMITNQLISYVNDLSGVPSVLQGSGAKGGAKTATGSQILQSNVKGELQDLIEDIEQRVLMPVMEMIHSLGQQYESAKRWLAITGGEKVQFTRDMLEGEFSWKWVASSQAVNQQMRAQATMQFLQAAANPAVLQLLQLQGKVLNPDPALRKMWEDGLGLRNYDQVVTAAPMQPPMGGPPGMGGPQGMPPGMGPQDPRSAVEQAPGGSEGMAPGEGEAFGEVREGADMMAAQAGASGGFDQGEGQ